MAKNQVKTTKNDSKYSEDWLPITNIQGGLIEVQGRALEGKQIVTGVRVEPKNIFISDEETQNRTIYALRNFYNSLDYEFWLICCDRPVDINLYKSELEVMLNRTESAQTRKLILQDLQKCDMFTGPAINAVDTEFYLLFKDSPKNMERIQKRVHNMISGLASAGLVSRQMTEEDVRVLLDSFLNDSKRIEYGTVMSDV
ncbi:MAG: hypothetical protein K2G03_02445 [Bacilli bacterium]|nr:hypothetical protein [Bacilli bacterium]MDE6141440.1 hypothetical protein [Bacilli bacterium]